MGICHMMGKIMKNASDTMNGPAAFTACNHQDGRQGASNCFSVSIIMQGSMPPVLLTVRAFDVLALVVAGCSAKMVSLQWGVEKSIYCEQKQLEKE